MCACPDVDDQHEIDTDPSKADKGRRPFCALFFPEQTTRFVTYLHKGRVYSYGPLTQSLAATVTAFESEVTKVAYC